MIGLARLLVIGFVILTIVYMSLSFYSRSVRRAKLEDDWVDEGRVGDLDSYLREGMAEYDKSLRKKLIWGVYVVPVVLVGVLIYVINFM